MWCFPIDRTDTLGQHSLLWGNMQKGILMGPHYAAGMSECKNGHQGANFDGRKI